MIALADKRILLIEDEALVAILTKEWLEEEGAVVVGPEPSVERALRAAEIEAFDAAVLDVQLSDGRSASVAERLRARGIPFVVATGFERPREAAFEEAALLPKPYRRRDLLRALGQVLASQSPAQGES